MENASAAKHAENSLQISSVKPFDNIALAFSGGGFRAATFAFGVLSYFDRVKFGDATDPLNCKSLLQQVTYLSSASGGTIPTSLYALYNARGKTFAQFYVKLFETLTGEKVLEKALVILADKKRWGNSGKSRNLINAFSVAYDEYIFEGHTLQSLFAGTQAGAHLQEVCFNTTEFYTGLSFRQDVKLVPDTGADRYFKYGNENIFLDHTVAQKIKLGDTLAASSCFPGGFAPLIFPDDFTHDGLNADELKKGLTLMPQTGDKDEVEFIKEKRLGLMDGGITDNQGLQSMMYADGRRIRCESSLKAFDFMLVNDVGSYFMKPYVVPAESKYEGTDLSTVNWIMFFVFLIPAIGAILGILYHSPVLALISGILITIPAIFLILVYWQRKQFSGASKTFIALKRSFTEKIIKILAAYFVKTPLVVLKQMLMARADSVLMLNMSIFMKRIRQLIYDRFYGSTQWANRGKGNHIYDLTFSSDIYRAQNPPPSPFFNPSRDLQIVAQTAANMGTTLWFDSASVKQQHSQACIIACGEFTTCYNLMEYVEKLLADESTFDPAYKNRLLNLKQQLEADYTHFKADPFFMYNQNGIDYHIEKFKTLTVSDIPFPDNW